MKHIVRPAVLIVAAMAGSAIMVVALIGAAKSLTVFSRVPADFLPSSALRILLHTPTADTLSRWNLPQKPDPVAVAMLELHQGTAGTVTFLSTSTNAPRSLGQYGIDVSDPLLLPTVTLQADSVNDTAPYQAMTKAIGKNAPWAYVSAALLGEANTFGVRSLRTILLGDGPYFGYAANTDSVTLLHHKEQRPSHEASPTVPHVANRIFAINYGNANEAWQTWKTRLSSSDASVLEGLLRAYIGKFGTAVSFEHDVLKLMQEPGTLQFSQTGGTVQLLLSGTHSDENSLNRILKTMRSAYENTLPTTRITHRVLDQRFSTTDLRHDETLILREETQVGDYRVTETRQTDNQNGLLTATNGNRFHISTDRTLLQAALESEEVLVPDARNGTRTAEMFADLDALREKLAIMLPKDSVLLENLGTGTLLFFSEWKADVQSQTIRLPQNSQQLLDSLL